MERVFAHLLVRGGGSSFHRKNFYPLLGESVLGHALKLCRDCGVVDEIFVWSEDAEAAAIAKRFGAHALTRPRGMVHYHSGFYPIAQWSKQRMEQVAAIAGDTGDIHFNLNCNNFLVKPSSLQAMLQKLKDDESLMRILAVSPVRPGLCLEYAPKGNLMPFWNDPLLPLDEHPPLFRLVGASFSHLARGYHGLTSTGHFPVSPEEGFDFQHPDDVVPALFYLKRRAKNAEQQS